MAIRNVFADIERRKQDIENLGVDEFANELAAGDALVLDIRELQERVDLGTVPGSRHVPRGMLEFWADPASPYFRDYFEEDRRTIVFCAGGGRSVLATLALRDMGYQNVAHLEAGFKGWKEAGHEIEDVRSTSRWIRRPD